MIEKFVTCGVGVVITNSSPCGLWSLLVTYKAVYIVYDISLIEDWNNE